MRVASSRPLAVVIEDDADVRHLIETVLTQAGFETISRSNGVDGIEAVRAHDPQVTTLDVSMPGMDGFAVAKQIRGFSQTYLVMISALGEEIDVIQGLEAGADDYLVKPFRPRELRARVDAMLRRPRDRRDHRDVAAVVDVSAPDLTRPSDEREVVAAAPSVAVLEPVAAVPPPVEVAEPAQGTQAPVPTGVDEAPEAWIRHKGLELNEETRLVVVDGTQVDLTRSEFDLLAALMVSGRRVRSKADLVLTVRDEGYVTTYMVTDADKRAIEVHMANLRRKLGDTTGHPRWIETVRGVGYRLAADS